MLVLDAILYVSIVILILCALAILIQWKCTFTNKRTARRNRNNRRQQRANTTNNGNSKIYSFLYHSLTLFILILKFNKCFFFVDLCQLKRTFQNFRNCRRSVFLGPVLKLFFQQESLIRQYKVSCHIESIYPKMNTERIVDRTKLFEYSYFNFLNSIQWCTITYYTGCWKNLNFLTIMFNIFVVLMLDQARTQEARQHTAIHWSIVLPFLPYRIPVPFIRNRRFLAKVGLRNVYFRTEAVS